MEKPKYINWIVEENGVVFEDNIPLNCYVIKYSLDYDILDDWALHIREHYISDDELRESLSIHNLNSEEYLRKFVIPQKSDVYGSVSRSNDITEILLSDLLEYILNYTVPRCKQQARSGKTLSEHGTDIIAYKFYRDSKEPTKNDELIAAEVKSQLTSDSVEAIISAASDSQKDEQRYAHTLDYYRKKLKSIGNNAQATEVARFQKKPDQNYKITFIGAAVSSLPTIENNILLGISGSQLKLQNNQKIFYIHGKKLMDLTHEIFERCIK